MKYLSGSILVLKWALLYPVDNFENKFIGYMFSLWKFCFKLSIFITAIQCVIFLVTTPFDLVEDALIVVHTVLYICLPMNFIFFHLKKNAFIDLINRMNRDFIDGTDNDFEKLEMDRFAKLTDLMSYGWSIGCWTTTLFLGMVPYFMNNRELPVAVWFPYDYTPSPTYELTYLWQIYSQINMGMLGSSDAFYPSMTLLIGQQFRVLGINFQNCFQNALLKSGISRERIIKFSNDLNKPFSDSDDTEYSDVYSVINSSAFKAHNKSLFLKNVKHHKLLLDYCRDFNDAFAYIIMFKLALAILYVVFIAFSMLTVKTHTVALGLGIYASFSVSQFVLYCYGGQLMTQGAEISSALYETPWYLCDVKFHKLLLLVQMRTSRSVYCKAGNYFLMDAPQFLAFMKSIFSYVALLRELSARSDS